MQRILFIIGLTTVLTACRPDASKKVSTASESASAPATTALSSADRLADCAYITQDHQNRPVICWTEEDTTHHEKKVYFAVSADGGKTFGKPVLVPTHPHLSANPESTPKVAFKGDGTLVAVYQISEPTPQNEYAGSLLYTQSSNGGANWSNPVPIHSDTNPEGSRSFFDLTRLNDGEVGCTWLDGDRAPVKKTQASLPGVSYQLVQHDHGHGHGKGHHGNGRPVYFAKTQAKAGFGPDKRIAQPACECCRTELFVDKKGYVHLAYRALYPDGSRDMAHSLSTDHGNTFTAPTRISPDQWQIQGCPHTGPALAANEQQLMVTWYTGKEGEAGIYFTSSNDGGCTFSARSVVQAGATAKHPQVITGADGMCLVVWDESVSEGGAYHSRIGLKRMGNTPLNASTFLTPSTTNAFHPALFALEKSAVLVAWTQEEAGHTRVYCQRME